MKKIYRKCGANQTASVYQAEDKEKMILVPVNRQYNQSKKPIFYLKRGVEKSKPKYLTGLFATKNPKEYSGDFKDCITGMKVMLKVVFEDGGEYITIEGASKW